jgi:hypothetical protein
MKHKFEGGREPNTANGPGESWSDCAECGAAETDDNKDEECVPVEDDDSVVAPILPPYEG